MRGYADVCFRVRRGSESGRSGHGRGGRGLPAGPPRRPPGPETASSGAAPPRPAVGHRAGQRPGSAGGRCGCERGAEPRCVRPQPIPARSQPAPPRRAVIFSSAPSVSLCVKNLFSSLFIKTSSLPQATGRGCRRGSRLRFARRSSGGERSRFAFFPSASDPAARVTRAQLFRSEIGAPPSSQLRRAAGAVGGGWARRGAAQLQPMASHRGRWAGRGAPNGASRLGPLSADTAPLTDAGLG